MKVLVVEDQLDNAIALRMILEQASHEVRLSLTGPEALAAAKLGPWAEVVILDHYLPGMDGSMFLRELRQLPGWENVPVFLATGLPGGQAEEMVRSAPGPGSVTLLQKPFEPDRLLGALDELSRGPE